LDFLSHLYFWLWIFLENDSGERIKLIGHD
jgi:hypothetical protein